jgi:hypothetical protein
VFYSSSLSSLHTSNIINKPYTQIKEKVIFILLYCTVLPYDILKSSVSVFFFFFLRYGPMLSYGSAMIRTVMIMDSRRQQLRFLKSLTLQTLLVRLRCFQHLVRSPHCLEICTASASIYFCYVFRNTTTKRW